ncbi:MAG: hypothetical protein C0398_03310 [Coprothermobacter sp.]|nr:hypothetical protein [Coprothermobacter sp.]
MKLRPFLPFGHVADDAHRTQARSNDCGTQFTVDTHPGVEQLAVITGPRDILVDRDERILRLEGRYEAVGTNASTRTLHWEALLSFCRMRPCC